MHEAELNKKFHVDFLKKQRDILYKIQTPLLSTNQSRPRFEVANIKKKKMKRTQILISCSVILQGIKVLTIHLYPLQTSTEFNEV